MAYLSLNSAIDAFMHCRHKTDNKFWGLVAILHTIGREITPGKSYSISTNNVSNFLEDLFCLQSNKKKYTKDSTWSVIFSNFWIENIPQLMLHDDVNIYDVAAWYFRRRPLEEEITADKLVGKLLDELHLREEEAYKLFSFKAKQISFDVKPYSEEDLLKEIEDRTGEKPVKENKTVSFESLFLKSNPGALGQAPFIQTLYASQGVQKCLIITQFNFNKYYSTNESSMNKSIPINNEHIQVIYYGAPGTGKSYTINKYTKDKSVIRTTFHPDSDYSTFVGTYKPTTIEKPVMAIIGKNAEPVKNPNGTERTESEIVYDFVPQAFLKAYIEAWKNYYRNPASPEQQYLVIEEINRGNCAQIFGDLFQLLDRNEYGFSDYPISADDDIRRYLKAEFATFFNKEKPTPLIHTDFNKMYNKGYGDVAQKIFDGELMVFPKNLFIWATMNTCDQSLFPIDSAFKRRWDWKYVPITEALRRDEEGNVIKDAKGVPEHLDWSIKVGNIEYDWWSFITKVNEDVIYKLTSSEDKKLGYFFCKAKNGIISAETFTDKVIFYLWNEVFKDAPIEELKCLKNEDDKEHPQLTFQSFYDEDNNGKTIINEKSLNIFLTNLGVTIKNGKNTSEVTDERTQNKEDESENNEQ